MHFMPSLERQRELPVLARVWKEQIDKNFDLNRSFPEMHQKDTFWLHLRLLNDFYQNCERNRIEWKTLQDITKYRDDSFRIHIEWLCNHGFLSQATEDSKELEITDQAIGYIDEVHRLSHAQSLDAA